MTYINEQLDELIDLYALGALEPDETQQVEDYLARSSHARALLAQSKRVTEALAWTPEQRDPPAGAYERFQQRMAPIVAPADSPAAGRPAAPRKAPAIPSFWQRLRHALAPRRRWAGALMALLLIAAIGLGGWNLALRRDAGIARRAVAEHQELTALLANPATRLVALAPTGDPAGRTQVLVNLERDEGYLVADGLAPLPAGRTYQLWMIADGVPASMGTFDVDAQGAAAILMHGLPAPGAANLLGITVEPSGGSAQPTTTPILVGEM
ncbi:MAG TPA: anti-sigma factor [Herpetosiphonaceae bacterium]|nr:anti-sigma factor [Herpetosiphonaceae bacterium]